jgi:hypothetical protein
MSGISVSVLLMGHLTAGVLLASCEAALLRGHHGRESDHVRDDDGGYVRLRHLILSVLLARYLAMRARGHTCCSSTIR